MLSLPLADGIELRSLETWHARQFAELAERHRDFLSPWMPWAGFIVDEQSARGWLQDRALKRANDTFHMFGIWERDRLVGGIVYRVFDTYAGLCELGAWLTPEVTGRGLMTKACVHMIDWAVHERGMNRVEWRCDVNNAASRAVAKRLGMTLEGTHREAYVVNGKHIDDEVWAILAREWKSRTGNKGVCPAP